MSNILVPYITKSLKPKETYKEYKCYNNVIGITMLKTIISQYEEYAEGNDKDLTEHEKNFLSKLYTGPKNIKQLVSFEVSLLFWKYLLIITKYTKQFLVNYFIIKRDQQIYIRIFGMVVQV